MKLLKTLNIRFRIHAMRFLNRTAIITGGASGIGLATALRFGAQGARIAIIDRDEKKAHDAVERIRAAGVSDAWASICDVGDENQVQIAVTDAFQRYNRLDIVINNAGLMIFKAITELNGADWLRILNVDLLGAFYFTKYAFLVMRPGGAIVNVSSIHALETEPLVAPYAAAKAALLSLTRSSALEGKPKGIRINAILPGAVNTPMLWDNPNIRSGVESVVTADVGSPDDIAAAIEYLASDDAKFVQGAALRADGGRLDRL
jgi:meso-butanediol dehydrogenase/(S,S)-butanediol dehydrogenase/diacetyl reductase